VPPNPDSILDSVKKVIGIDSSDTSFDLDVTLFINSALGALRQLGVGSDTGFMIQDNTTLWSQYISDLSYLGMIKAYISLQVKMNFDPPDGRYALPAFQDQIKQLEVRINLEAERINPPTDPFATTSAFVYGTEHSFLVPTVVQLQFSYSVTPDASTGNVFYLTLTDDCTINAPINGSDGEHVTLDLTSNGHTVTWGNGWDFGDAGIPVLSGAGHTDIISAYYKEPIATWRAGFTTGF
jgi:hypothetical protein